MLQLHSRFEPMMCLRGVVGDYRPRRALVVAADSGMTASVTGRGGVERKLVTATHPHAVEGHTLEWNVELNRGRPRTIVIRHVVSDGEHLRRACGRLESGHASGVPAKRDLIESD